MRRRSEAGPGIRPTSRRTILFDPEFDEGDGDVTTLLRSLDRLIGTIVAAAKWLALPLIVLLFLQWPLRELLGSYSREANDLGQVAFAIFVAVSITAATRAGTHLAADLLAQHYKATTRRRLKQAGAAIRASCRGPCLS